MSVTAVYCAVILFTGLSIKPKKTPLVNAFCIIVFFSSYSSPEFKEFIASWILKAV